VHPVAQRNATDYLRIADRLFGPRLVGFYVVGSAAYDEFRPNRSDLDFVAVLDGRQPGDCRVLRKAQVRSALQTAPRALRHGSIGTGTCNGVYVCAGDLTRPVTEIEPIGSHVGISLHCGDGFDVNPVQWKTFAERGVALRGPEPSTLGLDPQPELLRQWNLDNLNSYWKRVATGTAAGRRGLHSPIHSARWVTSWTVLGPVRLHHTIATGAIVSKEKAAAYAVDTFDGEWHSLIRDAVGFVRGEPADPTFKNRRFRLRRTGEFALHVIEAANSL
jgi:hypothetical protein